MKRANARNSNSFEGRSRKLCLSDIFCTLVKVIVRLRYAILPHISCCNIRICEINNNIWCAAVLLFFFLLRIYQDRLYAYIIIKNRTQNEFGTCSPGRARTYNNSVNSRVLCHWATEEYLDSGNVLLSRAVSSQVPSALKGLTSVFGMGTGGTPSPSSPEIVNFVCAWDFSQTTQIV